MLFMSENAKNYAGLFYRWLLMGRNVKSPIYRPLALASYERTYIALYCSSILAESATHAKVLTVLEALPGWKQPARLYDDVHSLNDCTGSQPGTQVKPGPGSRKIFYGSLPRLASTPVCTITTPWLEACTASACVSADLDPSIYFVCDRLENDDVEFWEPNPRTPKRGFGSPADLDPDSQRIVEDLFRQVHLWLTVTDRLF